MRLNRKGFTLVEVISVVVILGIIVAIVFPSFFGYFDASKKTSEEIFLKETSRIIDSYVSLEGSNLNFGINAVKIIDKCENAEDLGPCRQVNVYESTSVLTFKDVIDANLITENDLINPNSKSKCNINSSIYVYRDQDYVHCFKTNLDCVSTKNASGIDTYDINTCGW